MRPLSSICKACGQPIVGDYLTALGTTWHPGHFLCTLCHLPIGEAGFQTHQGLPYHVACYAEHVAPRCAYCHKPLMTEHLIDHWGTRYCREHQQQYPPCNYCGRLVPPWQQEQTSRDNVVRCPICRSSAIEDIEEARPLFSGVKRWVSGQGLVYNNLPLSLELCGRERLAFLLQSRSQTHALGATVSSTYLLNGLAVRTDIQGVAVLRGLPAMLFQGVTVHELGHVWLLVHEIQLPLWAEEGFCELLSYRFYTALNTPESAYHATNIEHNADPIYGEGFRHLRTIADASGFPRLLETMRSTKRLPEYR